jgi:hypothetical protein
VTRARDDRRRRFLFLVAAVAVADWTSASLSHSLGLPFYLDTWATSVGVMTGGLAAGIAGGVVYNALMALTFWGPWAIVWALSSALVACLTHVFWRRGWLEIEHPLWIAAAGATTGVANTVLALVVPPEGSVDEGARVLRQVIEAAAGPTVSRIAETLLIEITDKTVCIIVATAVTVLLQERWAWARRPRPHT